MSETAAIAPRGTLAVKEQPAHDVFLSYAREDEKWAQDRAAVLKAGGLDVFVDVESVKPGDPWQQRIDEGLRRARRFFLGWSRHAAASEAVEREWREALRLRVHRSERFINIERLDGTPLPEELASTQACDAGSRTRVRLEIVLDKQFEQYREQDVEVLRMALAGLLGVPPSSIKVLGKEPGSVRIGIDVDAKAAATLCAMAERGDPLYKKIASTLRLQSRRQLPASSRELLSRYAAGERRFLWADLSGTELGGADLHGADLSSADLHGANLSGANLSGANFSGADLSGADLSGADLSGANLILANLIKGNFQDANLIRATLIRVSLIHANLSGADLICADLSSASLIRANLSGADLIRANLSSTDLIRTDLHGADLSSAKLIGADLSGARLSGADTTKADLRNVNLNGADLHGTSLGDIALGSVTPTGTKTTEGKLDASTSTIGEAPVDLSASHSELPTQELPHTRAHQVISSGPPYPGGEQTPQLFSLTQTRPPLSSSGTKSSNRRRMSQMAAGAAVAAMLLLLILVAWGLGGNDPEPASRPPKATSAAPRKIPKSDNNADPEADDEPAPSAEPATSTEALAGAEVSASARVHTSAVGESPRPISSKRPLPESSASAELKPSPNPLKVSLYQKALQGQASELELRMLKGICMSEGDRPCRNLAAQRLKAMRRVKNEPQGF